MAISELRLAVKPDLSPAELSDVSALVTEANWNQLAADWRIFMEYGRLHVAQTATGRIVASTATLPYGGRFAWISMVLVAGAYRRRGLATALLRQAMEELAAARLTPVLDATPDGRAVYQRLGFLDSWGFHRLVRRERPRTHMPPAPLANCIIRPISDADWARISAYDASAFGADRKAVLAGLRGRLPAAELVAEYDGDIVGFLFGRDGRLAQHLGPLIAEDSAVACTLLDRALAALEGPVFIDLADTKTQVRSFLDACGFNAVRPFTRMLYATSSRFDDAARTFAVVGPEFG